MTIALNHTIVPAHDKNASAHWLADLFGLEVRDKSPFSPPGRFAVVRIGEINLDFDEAKAFEPHHYAFLVDEEAFDRILGRVKALGLTYAADPVYEQKGKINHHEGGRGVYFRDPNGHNLELLTRTGEAR
jgi:catechol 2,3-dioxygenase-like lactoylglutathione lyase family enzyme